MKAESHLNSNESRPAPRIFIETGLGKLSSMCRYMVVPLRLSAPRFMQQKQLSRSPPPKIPFSRPYAKHSHGMPTLGGMEAPIKAHKPKSKHASMLHSRKLHFHKTKTLGGLGWEKPNK